MMTIKDGNESDKQHFQKIMKDFVNQWDGSKMNFFVMDSGAYSAENIREWQCTKWIIRAPRSIRLVVDLIESTKEDDLKTIDKDPRYKRAHFKVGGGLKQREGRENQTDY